MNCFLGAEPRITVTTHGSVFNKIAERPGSSSSTQKPKSIVSYGLTHSTGKNFNYDYNYQQTEGGDEDYNTEVPLKGYSYHEPLEYEQHTDLESDYKKTYVPTTKTPDSFASSSFSPSKTYFRTEKPPLQIPQSLIPTLPPLTFSSPAPFTLTRHFDQKRSNDHHEPPKIIVSASASVSDASGRRLNYSLGTIGASHIIGTAPTSYDDYKETDVGLDPFYHDVPKVKNGNNKIRQKRDLRRQRRSETVTHWIPPDYVDDNYEPLTYEEPTNLEKLNASLITENPKITDDYYEEILEDTKNNTEIQRKESGKEHKYQIDERIDRIENEEVNKKVELSTHDSLKDLINADIINKYVTESPENNLELTTKNSLELAVQQSAVTQPTTVDIDPVTNVVPTTTCCTNKKRTKEDYEKATRFLDQLLAELLKEALNKNFPKLQRKPMSTTKTENKTEYTTTTPVIETTTENILSTLENAKLETVTVTESSNSENSNSIPTETPEDTTEKIIVTTLPTLKSILARNRYLEIEENLPVPEISSVAPPPAEPKKHILGTEINILKSVSSSEEEYNKPEFNQEQELKTKPKEFSEPNEFINREHEPHYVSSTEVSTVKSKTRGESKYKNRVRGRTRYTTKTTYYDTSTEKIESTPNYRSRGRSYNRKALDNIGSESMQHTLTPAQPELNLENDYDPFKLLESKTEDTVLRFTVNDKYISSTKETILESETRHEATNNHFEVTTKSSKNQERAHDLVTEAVVLEALPTSDIFTVNLEENVEESKIEHQSTTTATRNTVDTEMAVEIQPTVGALSTNLKENDEISTHKHELSTTPATTTENVVSFIDSNSNSQNLHENINYESTYSPTITEDIPEQETTEIPLIHKLENRDKTEIIQPENESITESSLTEEVEKETVKNLHPMKEISSDLVPTQNLEIEPTTENVEFHTTESVTELSTPMDIHNNIFDINTESVTETITIEKETEKIIDLTSENIESTTENLSTEIASETTLTPLVTEESTLYDVSKNTIFEDVITTTENFRQYLFNTKINDNKQETDMKMDELNTNKHQKEENKVNAINSDEESTESNITTTQPTTENTETTEITSTEITENKTFDSTETNQETSSEISTQETTNSENTSTEITTISPTTITSLTTSKYSYHRSRKPTYKRNRQKPTPHSKHRFSSQTIIMSPSVLRLGNKRLTTEMIPDDNLVTDSELNKSANPTEAKHPSTTPITKVVFSQKKIIDKNRRFNCLDKKLNRFYEDPRDCRLFHYCTPGFSETQVLDMKFVCDSGTYFDVEKLICTKTRPIRCK